MKRLITVVLLIIGATAISYFFFADQEDLLESKSSGLGGKNRRVVRGKKYRDESQSSIKSDGATSGNSQTHVPLNQEEKNRYSLGEVLKSGKGLNQLLMNDKLDKNILAKSLGEEVKKSVKCITDKSCLSDSSGRFYDAKIDPEVFKLTNTIDLLLEMSVETPRFIENLSDADLIKSIEMKNTELVFLSTKALIKKGSPRLKETFEIAKDFGADSAQSFIKLIDESFGDSNEEKKFAHNLILNYIEESDLSVVSKVIDELNHRDLDKQKVSAYVQKTCQRVKNGNLETEKMIRYNIEKVARKYEVEVNCKI